MAAKRKVNRVDRYSHILPTVNEWAPKSTDINNPDAHKQTEINAIAIANKKVLIFIQRDFLDLPFNLGRIRSC